MNASDCILFSGGAPGAEAAFGACAERYGIEEVNFTFAGHKIDRQRGVRVLNHEELLAGDVSLEYVSRLMHRRYAEGPTIRKVLQSLWYQLNNGQEIGDRLDPRGRHGEGPHRVGCRIRQAMQQAAVGLRPGPRRVVSLERRRLGPVGRFHEARDQPSALHRHRHPHPAGQRTAKRSTPCFAGRST